MRLLNSHTLSFVEFGNDDDIPPYAILSHTWGRDEVTFQDMLSRKAVMKEGFQKIKFTAAQAIRDKLDYFWIDTCCIDKSSSAELSESLNSMFKWYKQSQICYAYMSDISEERFPRLFSFGSRLSDGTEKVGQNFNTIEHHQNFEKDFLASSWFTRGWTLQELIAPSKLNFYSAEWRPLKDKYFWSHSMVKHLGIPYSALLRFEPSKFSIAAKMSWAAKRQTKRVEDKAYCLLGLFGIHLPMLYGEGSGAFIRFQEELLRVSDDRSIFCWTDPNASSATHSGLLASSPAQFANCGAIKPMRSVANSPYQLTNRGIMIELQFLENKEKKDQDRNEYIVILSGLVGTPESHGLILAQLTTDTYARVDVSKLWRPNHVNYRFGAKKTVFIRQSPLEFPRKLLPHRVKGFIAAREENFTQVVDPNVPFRNLFSPVDDDADKVKGTLLCELAGEKPYRLDIDLVDIVGRFKNVRTDQSIQLPFDRTMRHLNKQYACYDYTHALAMLTFVRNELWISLKLKTFREKAGELRPVVALEYDSD